MFLKSHGPHESLAPKIVRIGCLKRPLFSPSVQSVAILRKGTVPSGEVLFSEKDRKWQHTAPEERRARRRLDALERQRFRLLLSFLFPFFLLFSSRSAILRLFFLLYFFLFVSALSHFVFLASRPSLKKRWLPLFSRRTLRSPSKRAALRRRRGWARLVSPTAKSGR